MELAHVTSLLAAVYLRLQAPARSERVEIESGGIARAYDVWSVCEPHFPSGQTDDVLGDCAIDLPDKDQFWRARACNRYGCGPWTAEPRLSCEYVLGTGCPTWIYPTSEVALP